MEENKAVKVLKELREHLKKEVIYIKATENKQLTLTQSKFGGLPYVPKNGQTPTTKEGKQLTLLAQINCEELPENTIYPKTGILQFWIFNNEVYGQDFSNPLSNETSRVTYHEHISEYLSEEELKEVYQPTITNDGDMMPFTTTFSLEFRKDIQGITMEDRDFNKEFSNLWNKKYPENEITAFYDLDKESLDGLYALKGEKVKHQLGGFPFFAQDDRRYDDELKDYTELLFQMDSQFSKNWEIIWGDAGVANFFITKEQLQNRDFSKVLYNWDCS